jgi:hypothetical protein
MSDNTYTPNRWVIVKIVIESETVERETMFRILGGWSGGYLDGDSWRLGSPIDSCEEKENYIIFHNESGSSYDCNKLFEGMNIIMHETFMMLKNNPHVKEIDVIDYADFEKVIDNG